jgi:hypothetical protein
VGVVVLSCPSCPCRPAHLVVLLVLVLVVPVPSSLLPISTPQAVAHGGGSGSWSWHPGGPCVSPPHHRSIHQPPHEQLRVRLGQVVCRPRHPWSVLIPVVALSSVVVTAGTHHPPYEQGLAGMGEVLGWYCVIAVAVAGLWGLVMTWHKYGVEGHLPSGYPPPWVSRCSSAVSYPFSRPSHPVLTWRRGLRSLVVLGEGCLVLAPVETSSLEPKKGKETKLVCSLKQ